MLNQVLLIAFFVFSFITPITELIENRQFIAIVEKTDEKWNNSIKYDVVEFYKGSYNFGGNNIRIEGENEFEVGEQLLVFGDFKPGYRERIHTENLMLIPLKSVKQDVFDSLNQLPCFVQEQTIEARKEKSIERGDKYTLTGSCHRVYNPVCGCNGVTYGNTCEMYNAGIVRYKPGECK